MLGRGRESLPTKDSLGSLLAGKHLQGEATLPTRVGQGTG